VDLISCRRKLTNLTLLIAVLVLCIAPVHEFVKIQIINYLFMYLYITGNSEFSEEGTES